MPPRIHITGASGSGTSTLGRALADLLAVPHLDTDDFYWEAGDPPFTVKRGVAERLRLLGQAQGPGGWVLSGSLDGWGEPALTGCALIVLLTAPTPIRLLRLRRREAARFGDRIAAGGDMVRNHSEFLKWAASYDDAYFQGRSLTRHLNWLSGRNEQVLELDGRRPAEELAEECRAALGG